MLERAVSARQPPTATPTHRLVDAVPTKRETSAWRFFPASRRLLGAAAESIEHPDTDTDGYLQALRLCDACAEHWQAFSTTLPRYTGEVLRFELHQVPDPEKANGADELLFREPGADPPAGVTALAPNVTLRRFDYDMDALTCFLESDRDAPADWPDEPSYYVFQHLPDRQRNRVLRVSPAVYRFLALIDCRSIPC